MNICEYFNKFLHTIYNVISNPETLEQYCNSISAVLVGVVAIIGINYLKPLKDKTLSATFNFWSQLNVHLLIIKKWLEQDCGILDNLYSAKSKVGWSKLTPENSRIAEFKQVVNNALSYIKSANDQMPAYKGWSNDYSILIGYLEDCIIYNICDHEHYFKFNEEIDENSRKKYVDDICLVIDRLINGIDKKQNTIETKLFKK